MGMLDEINELSKRRVIPEVEKMIWGESPLLQYLKGYRWGRYKVLFRMAKSWGYPGDLYR